MTTRSTLRLASLLAAFALAATIASCGGTPTPPADPYADPGTPPPPTITNSTIATSGSVAPKPGSPDLIEVNVAGFEAPDSAGAATLTLADLDASAFVVVEDGVVKGVTVERIGGGTRAAADIAFVVDTTGSMGAALASVQDSIVAFVDFLDAGGLDVRVGAVTFGDAFDTLDDGSTRSGVSISGRTPPPFDLDERPSFPLTSDFAAFRDFIAEDSPRFGGDTPENALGALEFAYDSFEWRAGAQRILIVIIDTCSHNDVTFAQYGTAGEPWLPPNPDDLLGRMRGNTTVHSVSPANVIAEDVGCSSDHTDMAMFTGAGGTGGLHVPVAFGEFDFDLTALPIATATTGGYVITYRGRRDGSEHTVRVVIDDGATIRGEFTVTATY
jgi:hypothetical protein